MLYTRVLTSTTGLRTLNRMVLYFDLPREEDANWYEFRMVGHLVHNLVGWMLGR